MASVQPVLRAVADLVHEIHTTPATIPQEINELADRVIYALDEYQLAVDMSQQKRTNYRVRGKKR